MARALIVDDEYEIAELIADVLRPDGWHVDLAHDGEQAWARFEQTTYSLVVSDVRMRGVDGVELLRRIRARFRSLPVVLLTGFSDYDDASLTQAGASAVVQKPFRLDALRLLLNQLRAG